MHGITRPVPLVHDGAAEALKLVATHYRHGHPNHAITAARQVAAIAPAAAQMAAVVVACGQFTGFTPTHIDALMAHPLHREWPPGATRILDLRRTRTPKGSLLYCTMAIANAIEAGDAGMSRAELLAAAAHLGILELMVRKPEMIPPFRDPRDAGNMADWQLRLSAIGTLNPLVVPGAGAQLAVKIIPK